jgi:FAD/FMN-containing dehydrogenase
MTASLDNRTLADRLRRHHLGPVLTAADEGYDPARSLWNGMIDRRPAVIAQATNAADVQRAIGFALDHDLAISVRGGGHGVAGNAVVDGGLMVDLSRMTAVQVDADAGTVEAGPGVTLGVLDAATSGLGLAVPAGIVTHTGIAGLTLGGGIGWLMRQHGLTCDALVEADVVTADGRLVTTNQRDDPDLLWALRGGGGNFGVVTRFRYLAVPLRDRVLAGAVLYDLVDGERVLRRYRDWAAGSPDAVTTILTLRRVMALPSFPPELHGRPVVSIAVCHTGDGSDPEGDIAALRTLGEPLFDTIALRPFAQHQGAFDAGVPWGHQYYWKSHFLDGLTDGAIETMVDQSTQAPGPWSYTIMFQLGGAAPGAARGGRPTAEGGGGGRGT